MTQNELIEKLAKEEVSVIVNESTIRSATLTKAAAGRVIDFIARSILADLLLDGRSAMPGLGIFKVVSREARYFVPPKGEPVTKPAWKTIKFKAFSHIKDKL